LTVDLFGAFLVLGGKLPDGLADLAGVEAGQFKALLDGGDADGAGDGVLDAGLVAEVLVGYADVTQFPSALPVFVLEGLEQREADLGTEVADAGGETFDALDPVGDRVRLGQAVHPDDVVGTGIDGLAQLDGVFQRVLDADDALDTSEIGEEFNGGVEVAGVRHQRGLGGGVQFVVVVDGRLLVDVGVVHRHDHVGVHADVVVRTDQFLGVLGGAADAGKHAGVVRQGLDGGLCAVDALLLRQGMVLADVGRREERPDALVVQVLGVLRELLVVDFEVLVERCEETDGNATQTLLDLVG